MQELNRRKLLIADDEPEIRAALSESLSKEYDVIQAENGQMAFEHAMKSKPDLIILDIYMPMEDGLKTCHKLRSTKETRHIPVMMITGMGELNTKLEAFQLGADDFIEKPFPLAEIKARVKSKMKRLEEANEHVNRCGNLSLILDRFEAVFEDGDVLKFSTLEFSLLSFFLQNREKIVSRSKILGSVWSSTHVNDRTVDTHIVSLRRKLAKFDYEISSVYGAGYILRKKQANA